MEFNATFLVSIISFCLFVAIMNKILYEPISNIIKQRQDYIDRNESSAAANLNKATELSNEKESQLQVTRSSAKEIINSEIDKAKEEKSQAKTAKQQELLQMTAEHRDSLQNQKAEMSEQINQNISRILTHWLNLNLKTRSRLPHPFRKRFLYSKVFDVPPWNTRNHIT